jgi:hypothetical protein
MMAAGGGGERIRKLSAKDLKIAIDKYLVVIDRLEHGYLAAVYADNDEKSKFCKNVQCVLAFVHKVTENAKLVKYISRVLSAEERQEEVPSAEELMQEHVIEAETEYVVHPLGLSDTYYYLARDGMWYKIYRDDSGVRVEPAAVSMKRIVRVANIDQIFRSFPPSGANVDLDATLFVDELLTQVRDLISAYVETDKKYINIAAVWSVLTFTRHAFIFSEYLQITKSQFGAGGTTFAHVVASFSSRATANLIDPTPAVLFRLAHHYKPTVVIDEVREDALNRERLEMNKLLVENAFDVRNVVPRLESVGDGRTIVAYRPYANLVIVDTSLKFSNLSAQRRAWRVAVRRADRVANFDSLARDAQNILDKLYSFGLVFPLIARRYVEMYRSEQGLGALKALRDYMAAINADTSIVDDVYNNVKQQLDDAYLASAVIDPAARIVAIVKSIVDDALGEFVKSGVVPVGWHVDRNNDRCIYIYLERLISRVRSKAMQLRQIDTSVELDEAGRPVSHTKFQRQWYVVDSELESYLTLKKMRLLLKTYFDENSVTYDDNRNLIFRICTE